MLNSSGDCLAARLDPPDGPPLATALFAHCFTCGKDVVAASRTPAGLAVPDGQIDEIARGTTLPSIAKLCMGQFA